MELYGPFKSGSKENQAMPETLAAKQAASGAELENFSCSTCRQRKVRCDRCHPCSQCVRAEKTCRFVSPVRGKRKRRKALKEGLHARLRRYEELLKSYGANIEPTDKADSSDSDSASERDVDMAEDAGSHIKDDSESFPKSRLVAKDGSSRYFDEDLWSTLADEFHHTELPSPVEAITKFNRQALVPPLDASDEHALVLSMDSTPEDLPSLHPTFPTLKRMWDIYTDRVDPLMKILHLPTFWSVLTNVLQNPQDISKGVKALIFAFYYAVTSSCGDDECRAILGERQAIISARYRLAARQALIHAGFLKTTSLVTLQAYTIFLIGAKGHYHMDSLFMLSGVAVRLARRMGLHRDGASLGLSPFESEMRRRLWWQIVNIDLRASEFSGTIPSKDLFPGDAKIPLNVEDEDLSPDMRELPPERVGITSNVLCLLRCEITEFLCSLTPQYLRNVCWRWPINSSISLAEKYDLIHRIEDILERKYLRYCDPSNTLHQFASVITRSEICKMKLIAHNPRQFAHCNTKVPQKERDIILANGSKLLEYGNLLQNTPGLRKYMWQNRSGFLLAPLVYVLIETRHRRIGPEVDRVWQLIGSAFSNYPQIFEEAADALYAAVGKWTLQVWDECTAASKAEGLPEPATPEYISALRRCRRPLAEPNGPNYSGKASRNSTSDAEVLSLGQDGYYVADFERSDSYDFSNLPFYDLEPNEWLQWEHFLGGQGNLA